jgi:ornithine--oxo-acid transaminase
VTTRDLSRSADLIALAEQFGAHNYAPLDVVLCRGEGAFVWDVEGRRYVDMLSAYSALAQGHRHPRIIAALVEQAQQLTLSSRAFHNDRMGAMLERIATLSGFDKVLPMNSGAEAVETAIKALRRAGMQRRGLGEDEAEILVAQGNFHGRTTTIVSFSDEPEYRRGFGPPTPGFRLVPFGELDAMAAAIGPRTVGVLIEPIQGEAGVIVPPPGYLAGLRELCTRHDLLLAFDEIQTGLGRTGRMFAWQHEEARPDLLILGKALSGGVYPVSCVCADASVMSVFGPGSHGSTYGGNPLAAAVCIAALDVIVDEQLPERAARLGAHALVRLQRELASRPELVEVRGRGLMLAIEYRDAIARQVAVELAQVGVLAKETHGRIIRLLPPLVIGEAELDAALDAALPVLARA